MLILTSNGISSDRLFDDTKMLLKENQKNVALIPTASNLHEDKEHNIMRHTEIFRRLGLSVKVIDIAVENPELLNDFDVIFLMGGNPFYLLNIMKKTNCKELFSTYVKSKIVIGASAGSLALGPSIEIVYELHPELNDSINLTDFTGLCLTDIIVYSHASRYIEIIDRFLEKIHNYENRTGIQIKCINDGQAVAISDEEIMLI